jgi:hypothetical protein
LATIYLKNIQIAKQERKFVDLLVLEHLLVIQNKKQKQEENVKRIKENKRKQVKKGKRIKEKEEKQRDQKEQIKEKNDLNK